MSILPGIEAVGGVSATGYLSAADAVGSATAAGPLDGAGAAGATGGVSGASFVQALESVQGLQSTSADLAVKAVTGDLSDVHDYTIASAQAATALELTAAVRNKAVEAFTEIMRMQA
ncbi:flagellar hook-basal body complex protein FliE [Cellulomonas endophytica]|uniref:flagellar hook-basal body complex protein FliE n=1 Tax=Cellulomonas endophytica TaxID=2494735 RepID=UPI001011912A|nr:flagellar hook-basal body complex protein FliE [Cellulomonas endophytica]